ncbi:thiamine pyrophosphate-dependent enzyme [Stetteria hydrogenophila]
MNPSAVHSILARGLKPGPEGLSLLSERVEAARRRLLKLLAPVGGWHVGSSLSSLNIVAALYGYWVPVGALSGVERVVVLSKGHMAPALYAWLATVGVLGEEELESFARAGSRLQSHPDALRLRGLVAASSGSLGQGLSIANGIALAARIDGVAREVAVLLGDGELDEGQVWEAAATSASLGLDNVIAIVDRNMTQHTGPTEEVKPKEPLAARWAAFGWHVEEVPNDLAAIVGALERLSSVKGKPKVIIVRSRGAGGGGVEE